MEEKVWHSPLLTGQHEAVFHELDLIFPEEAFDGPMQMALDEVLLRTVVRPTLRIYLWVSPCVSFGYFQKIDEVRSIFSGIPSVRRWTGGGMVEHGNDLTFSLTIPRTDKTASMPPALFYRELHGRIAQWLSGILCPGVRLARESDLRAGAACFVAPAANDLLMHGKKILGGAQRRSAGALLYQGSLQGVDQTALMADPIRLGSAVGVVVSTRAVLCVAQKEEAENLAERRYRQERWNGRR